MNENASNLKSPLIKKKTDDFACETCQINKQLGSGYGLLPKHDVEQVLN